MKRWNMFLSFAFFFVFGTSLSASAADYPSRNIEMVIPMLAGSAGDITGRLLAEELKKELNANVIVTNKPGGSFTLGTDVVARAKKDGYTIAYANSPAIVYAKALDPKSVPYDPFKDFDPLGVHVYFPQAIVVKSDSPWKTFKDLVDHAKKNPGALRCANPGATSASTFVAELVQSASGIKLTQVPTKGGQQVPLSVLGGHTEMAVGAISVFANHVQNGELRILLITRKLAGFPDVPTLIDLGYKQNTPSGWFGLYGPAGLPAEVKKVLVPAIKKAVESPVIKPKLEKLFYVIDYKAPAEQLKEAQEEYETVSAIAKKLGIQK